MMVRKLLVMFLVIMLLGFAGCKKSSEEQEQSESVKSMAEFEAEARETIDEENLSDELSKLEKEIESDIKAGE